MELLLIRHGLPEQIETVDGTPADPPLSKIGQQQAALVADWLDGERAIDVLYSSPMRRALETAQPLAGKQELAVELRDGVAEFDQNADNYIPVEKLKELDYERWRRLMRGELDDVDFAAFTEAVISTLNDIVASHAGQKVAVTCHGGVINVWTAHVLGLAPSMFFNPTYTSINRFMAASSGERTLIGLNERAHLRPLG